MPPWPFGATSGMAKELYSAAMQIAYDVELQDLLTTHGMVLDRSPGVRQEVNTLRVVCAGLALFSVSLMGWVAGREHLWIWMAGGGVGALVGFWGFPRWYRSAILRRLRGRYSQGQGKGLLGRQRLTVESDGLRAQSEAQERLLHWEDIEGVIRTPEHVFLFVRGAGALVIPVARITGGDLTAFLTEVKSRIQPA